MKTGFLCSGVMEPEDGCKIPMHNFNKVVFPQPDGPRSTVNRAEAAMLKLLKIGDVP